MSGLNRVLRCLHSRYDTALSPVRRCSIYKMPATATEAATTSLMGFFQKRKFKNFLTWVFNYDPESPGDFDAATRPMKDCYDKFGLDSNTQDFVGHAMALFTDDSYIAQVCGYPRGVPRVPATPSPSLRCAPSRPACPAVHRAHQAVRLQHAALWQVPVHLPRVGHRWHARGLLSVRPAKRLQRKRLFSISD